MAKSGCTLLPAGQWRKVFLVADRLPWSEAERPEDCSAGRRRCLRRPGWRGTGGCTHPQAGDWPAVSPWCEPPGRSREEFGSGEPPGGFRGELGSSESPAPVELVDPVAARTPRREKNPREDTTLCGQACRADTVRPGKNGAVTYAPSGNLQPLGAVPVTTPDLDVALSIWM